MRVAQVVWRLGIGGLENLARSLALRPNAPDSIVVCLRDHGEWGVELEQSGFPIFTLNRREGIDLSVIPRLKRLFATQRISIAHLHGYSSFLYGGLAARSAGIPSVYSEHAACYQGAPSLKRRVANRLLQHAPTRVTACSNNVRDFLQQVEGFTRHIDVVPNGLQSPEPGPAVRQQVRQELGIPEDAFVFLSVGRFEPVKGFGTLAKAGLEFANRTNGRLVIVGDGPERDHVLASIGSNTDQVILSGYDPNPYRFFAASDGYINSSLDEAASLSVIEAMAHGLPVVATKVGGNPELVIDHATGRLVDPARQSLLSAMLELSEDRIKAQALGRAAKARFESKYTEARMFDAYDHIYDEQRETSPATRGHTMRTRPKAQHCVAQVRVVNGAGGGPDKTIVKSTRYLREAGYRPLAIYMFAPDNPDFDAIKQRAEKYDCPLVAIPDLGPLDITVFRNALRTCREHNVTVWHGHDYKANMLGRILRRFHPMKLVSEVQGWVTQTPRMSLYKWIDHKALRKCDRVLTVSSDLFDECLERGVPRENLTLLENAVDTADFQRRRNSIASQARQSVPADRLLIGAAGRLSPEKGFDLLIRTVDEMISRGENLHLWIAGAGPERSNLEALIQSTMHPDRFELRGHVLDMRGYYEALDIFALSSLREGLPNVVLEAMAMELPVVATRCGGLGQFIGNSGSILTCEPGNQSDFRETLARLTSCKELRTRLGLTARQHVADFDFAARARRITQFYDELVDPDAE